MKILNFFDILEDKIRSQLSRYPLIYSLIGGTGVVLFWRGIWHTADKYSFMTGPVSIIIGAVILGLTGILVSAFIGNSIIIAGLRGEKKLEEKTMGEIISEEEDLKSIKKSIGNIEKELDEIKSDLDNS